MVSCYYVVNETQSIAFGYKERSSDPVAQVGLGQMIVHMALAKGDMYDVHPLSSLKLKY